MPASQPANQFNPLFYSQAAANNTLFMQVPVFQLFRFVPGQWPSGLHSGFSPHAGASLH